MSSNYGPSHTSFNAGAFTGGAMIGAAAIAGAMVAGVQNARARLDAEREQRYEGWTREQLMIGIDLAQELGDRWHRRADELERDNEQYRRAFQRITVRRTRRG